MEYKPNAGKRTHAYIGSDMPEQMEAIGEIQVQA